MTDRDDSLAAQAVALRRAGRSRREICLELGVGHARLARWLEGVPPHPGTRRPRAKDDVKAHARELRLQGRSVPSIALELDVAKSTVSLWVRDLPSPFPPSTSADRLPALARLGGEVVRRRADERRKQVNGNAASEIGPLTDRELMLVAVALYWAEGSKDKPYARRERVTLVNSDPDVIRVFLRWLGTLGYRSADLSFRLSIHETADLARAQRYWIDVTGAPLERFKRPSLKRHKPTPGRRNIGKDYVGCLVVDVPRSTDLYRRIAGWWVGLASTATAVGSVPGSTVNERSRIV